MNGHPKKDARWIIPRARHASVQRAPPVRPVGFTWLKAIRKAGKQEGRRMAMEHEALTEQIIGAAIIALC